MPYHEQKLCICRQALRNWSKQEAEAACVYAELKQEAEAACVYAELKHAISLPKPLYMQAQAQAACRTKARGCGCMQN